jgi:metal-responsive CopG/Arc/MetJ family transcriptional regulator
MARINVTLPEDTLISLRGLAKESNVTISEFVRNALRVYSALLTERNEGKYVYLGTRDKIEKELLIP